MKVHVVFDFPEITDPNSEEADEAIEILQDELKWFARMRPCSPSSPTLDWYIDEAIGEQE